MKDIFIKTNINIKSFYDCIFTIESGKRPKGGVKKIKSGIPSIGAEHIAENGLFFLKNLRFVPLDFYNNLVKGKILKGDILIVKDGATTGRMAYVNEDFPFDDACINEHVFILRIKPEYYSKLFYYILRSPIGTKSIKKNFQGAAQGGITSNFINDITIVIPKNPKVQKEIADKLEEYNFNILKITDKCNKQKEAISLFQFAILRDYFPYKVGDKLPNGWEWKKIYELCFVNPSKPKGFVRNSEKSTTYIPMEAVDGWEGKILNCKIVPFSRVCNGYSYFESGDILFAKITPCMQNAKSAIANNLIDDIGFGSTEFHVLRSKGSIYNKWVYYFIRTKEFLLKAENNFEGSAGQRRVPTYFLENTFIPYPISNDKQIILCNEIEGKLIKLNNIKNSNNKLIYATNNLLNSILKNVFPITDNN